MYGRCRRSTIGLVREIERSRTNWLGVQGFAQCIPNLPIRLSYTCPLACTPLHMFRDVVMDVIRKRIHYISVCCLRYLLSSNCGSYCRILRERLDSMAIVLLKSSCTICVLNCGGWWLESASVIGFCSMLFFGCRIRPTVKLSGADLLQG